LNPRPTVLESQAIRVNHALRRRGESGGRCRLVLNQPDLFDEHVAPDFEELVESAGDLERRWRSRAPVGEEPLHRPVGALWNGEAQLARGCHRLGGRVAVRERLATVPLRRGVDRPRHGVGGLPAERRAAVRAEHALNTPCASPLVLRAGAATACFQGGRPYRGSRGSRIPRRRLSRTRRRVGTVIDTV
jgi:hypothetical protein